LTWSFNKETYPDGGFPTAEKWKEVMAGMISQSEEGSVSNFDAGIWKTVYYGNGNFAFLVTEEGYMGIARSEAQVGSSFNPSDRHILNLIGDVLCLLLGCRVPLILRPAACSPTKNPSYEVVGVVIVHGVMHAELLLGELQPQYRACVQTDSFGFTMPSYRDMTTGETNFEDPRLGPIPDGWEQLPTERTSDDPVIFARFRNSASGEVFNADPRLFPKALEARGVKLETFDLV
jgi:predicted secreted protein